MNPEMNTVSSKSLDTEFGHGRRHQNDERAGRPADLITAAAERRD